MKGLKQYERDVNRQNIRIYNEHPSRSGLIGFTGLDLIPLEGLTEDNILQYFASSGFVEGVVRLNIRQQDRHLFEEICNECYLLIWDKRQRIIEIWQNEYAGAMSIYVKQMLSIQTRVKNSTLHKRIKLNDREYPFDFIENDCARYTEYEQ